MPTSCGPISIVFHAFSAQVCRLAAFDPGDETPSSSSHSAQRAHRNRQAHQLFSVTATPKLAVLDRHRRTCGIVAAISGVSSMPHPRLFGWMPISARCFRKRRAG